MFKKTMQFVGRGLAIMFCRPKKVRSTRQSKHILPIGEGELFVMFGEVCCRLRPEKLDEVLTMYPST